MARRSGSTADLEIAKTREMRWKFLIRNHQFRADIRELRRAFKDDEEDAGAKRNAMIEKWSLAEMPAGILREHIIPDDIPRKLKYYEEFVFQPPFGYPVEALAPINSSGRKFLNLKVDLSEPSDLVLHLVSEALREYRPVLENRRRRRLDKAEFQLRVFDLYEYDRKDFEEIAVLVQQRTRTIKGRRNTIRSAYVAAKSKIYGTSYPQGEQEAESHDYEVCQICSRAKRVEEFCRVGRNQLASYSR